MSLTKASYSMITGAPVNVLDFGATGNGSTDDTSAIQSALDYIATNGGVLVFPHAIYKITSMLSLTYNAGIYWKILGYKSTINVASGSAIQAALRTQIVGNPSLYRTHVEIEGLTIKGNNLAYTGILIDVDSSGNSQLATTKDVYIENCNVGMDVVGCMESTFYNTTLYNNTINLRLRSVPSGGSIAGGANQNSFYGLQMTNGSVGLLIQNNEPSLLLSENQFYGFLSQGMTNADVILIDAQDILIDGGHFESAISTGTFTLNIGVFGAANNITANKNNASVYSSQLILNAVTQPNRIVGYTTSAIISGRSTSNSNIIANNSYIGGDTDGGINGSIDTLTMYGTTLDNCKIQAEYLNTGLQKYYRSSSVSKLVDWKSNPSPNFASIASGTGVTSTATKTTGTNAFVGATDIVQYGGTAGSFSANNYYFNVTSTSGSALDYLYFSVIINPTTDTSIGITVSGTQALGTFNYNIKAGKWYQFTFSSPALNDITGTYSCAIYPTGTDAPQITFARAYIARTNTTNGTAQLFNQNFVA